MDDQLDRLKRPELAAIIEGEGLEIKLQGSNAEIVEAIRIVRAAKADAAGGQGTVDGGATVTGDGTGNPLPPIVDGREDEQKAAEEAKGGGLVVRCDGKLIDVDQVKPHSNCIVSFVDPEDARDHQDIILECRRRFPLAQFTFSAKLNGVTQ